MIMLSEKSIRKTAATASAPSIHVYLWLIIILIYQLFQGVSSQQGPRIHFDYEFLCLLYKQY